jgi:phage baseplate assembly protein W
MILGTAPGERVFNNTFGLGLQYRIFNVASPEEAEDMLNECAAAIKKWEDRITLVENQMRIVADVDRHFVVIIIPYIVNRTGIKSTFKKKLVSNT